MRLTLSEGRSWKNLFSSGILSRWTTPVAIPRPSMSNGFLSFAVMTEIQETTGTCWGTFEDIRDSPPDLQNLSTVMDSRMEDQMQDSPNRLTEEMQNSINDWSAWVEQYRLGNNRSYWYALGYFAGIHNRTSILSPETPWNKEVFWMGWADGESDR